MSNWHQVVIVEDDGEQWVAFQGPADQCDKFVKLSGFVHNVRRARARIGSTIRVKIEEVPL